MPNELIPGRNAVAEALRAGRQLERIIVSRESKRAQDPLLREARRRGIEVVFAERAALDSLVGRGGHQGIVAVAPARPPSTIDDIFAEAAKRKEEPFIVLLDGVEDPQNLGAIIRSAEAAGAHGIVIPERRAAGVTPAVRKASAGATEHIKVVSVPSTLRALQLIKKRGLWVVGADNRAERSVFNENLRGSVALVFGGEDKGISTAAAAMCDRLVRIPMKGRIKSLGVSAAAAIVIFEKMRQDGAENYAQKPKHIYNDSGMR
ncbi:MAG: 23S rRNA (guanosine(2251)-2'-O)-methyltransferase RlmB [Thermoplasmata archaeon]